MKTEVTRSQLLGCVRVMQDAESMLGEYIGQLEEHPTETLKYSEVMWYLKYVRDMLADSIDE